MGKSFNNKINILFIGVVGSERLISEIITNHIGIPHAAAQKYHRLLLEGMAKSEDKFSVEVVCMPEYNFNKLTKFYTEVANGIKFSYLTYFKNKFFKSFLNAFQIIILIIKWKRKNKYGQHYVMFDSLHFISSFIALLSHKILEMKLITTITDLPQFMFENSSENRIISLMRSKINTQVISNANTIVVLTKHTADYFNIPKTKVVIIEGLVDENQSNKESSTRNLAEKIIHYSGALVEQYGVKVLIDAFSRIQNPSIRLHLFGTGDMQEYIENCMKLDNRIKFFGYQQNKLVVKDQYNSFILVNPRLAGKDYTEYSFPSKTIEYMVSGIPLLTNRLSGIPDEYFQFVYLFKDQTVEGYKNTLEELLRLPSDEMSELGLKAQEFVLNNKNNKIQALKLYTIIQN